MPGVFQLLGAGNPPTTGNGFDTNAQAWFTRAATASGTAFSSKFQNAGNVLVLALKSAGLFTMLTGLYALNVEVSGQELSNVLSASNTLTKHGTTTLVAKTGITGDGSTGWYDTSFGLTASNMTAFSHGAICNTNGTFHSMVGTSLDSFVLTNIAFNSGLGGAVWRAAVGDSPTFATTATTVGHFSGTRGGANGVVLYLNGVQKQSEAISTHSPTSGQTFQVFADNGSFCDSQVSIVWFAASTGISAQNMSDLDAALKTFIAAVK